MNEEENWEEEAKSAEICYAEEEAAKNDRVETPGRLEAKRAKTLLEMKHPKLKENARGV